MRINQALYCVGQEWGSYQLSTGEPGTRVGVQADCVLACHRWCERETALRCICLQYKVIINSLPMNTTFTFVVKTLYVFFNIMKIYVTVWHINNGYLQKFKVILWENTRTLSNKNYLIILLRIINKCKMVKTIIITIVWLPNNLAELQKTLK